MFVVPDTFYEGQTVWIRAHGIVPGASSNLGLRCVVSRALGNHAHVQNAEYGVCRLITKWEARISVPDLELMEA